MARPAYYILSPLAAALLLAQREPPPYKRGDDPMLDKFRDSTIAHTERLEASCDCCGEMVPRDDIRVVIAYGIETGACGRCRGEPPEPDEGEE